MASGSHDYTINQPPIGYTGPLQPVIPQATKPDFKPPPVLQPQQPPSQYQPHKVIVQPTTVRTRRHVRKGNPIALAVVFIVVIVTTIVIVTISVSTANTNSNDDSSVEMINVGCYEDGGFENKRYYQYMSPSYCYKACQSSSYSYYGVSRTRCYCTQTLDGKVKELDDKCERNCQLASSFKCGGYNDEISVYRASSSIISPSLFLHFFSFALSLILFINY